MEVLFLNTSWELQLTVRFDNVKILLALSVFLLSNTRILARSSSKAKGFTR